MINPVLTAIALADGDGDGRIVLSDATAQRLGVPRGTVLLPDGTQGELYRYWIEGLPRIAVAQPVVVPPVPTDRTRPAGAFVTSGIVAGPYQATNITSVYRQKAGLDIASVEMRDFAMVNSGVLFRKEGGRLRRLVIERVSSDPARYAPGVGRGIFMAYGRTDEVTIRDIRFRCDDAVTSPGDVYPAIALCGKTASDFGSGFLFERLHLDGFETRYAAGSTAMPNCDGISIEALYTDGLIRQAFVARTADAAIDLKGPRWRITDVTTSNCHRGIKRWSAGHDGSIRTIDAGSTHLLSVVPSGEEWVLDYWEPVEPDPTRPLVTFETHPGSTVRVLNWNPAGINLARQCFARRGEVRPGACTLILPDRTITV